jgi:hypothetical protein
MVKKRNVLELEHDIRRLNRQLSNVPMQLSDQQINQMKNVQCQAVPPFMGTINRKERLKRSTGLGLILYIMSPQTLGIPESGIGNQ